MNRVVEWLLNVNPGELSGVDWTFRFLARFDPYVSFFLLCAGAAMVWLTIRSYRREGDAPRRVKAGLAAIRVLVIALALAIVFQPAIVLRFVRTLHSSLVVLVDDSLSMSFQDAYAQKEELARRTAALAGVEPEQLPGLSRVDLARRAMVRSDGALAKLARDHTLLLMRFGTDQPGKEAYTRPLDKPIDVVGAEAPPPGRNAVSVEARLAAAFNRLKAHGYETNLPAALRDALEAVQGRRTAGIIVISDGRMTGEDARQRLRGAQEYALQRGVPVYSVMVGDPTELSDLAVAALQAPREVRRGSPTEFTAVLTYRKMEGRTVNLRLVEIDSEGRQAQVAAASVTLDGADTDVAEPAARGVREVTLTHVPERAGRFVYRVTAESDADEHNLADNAAETVLGVADEKIKVLIVAGYAGWEFQRLRDYVYPQPDVYRVSLWQQNADAEVSQMASTGMRLTKLPRDLDELIGVPGDEQKPGYDVVVLFDPMPTKGGFDATFVENLRRYVEKGGGLCYIASNKHSDILLDRGADAEFKPLIDLLPVRLNPNTIDIAERIGRREPEDWPLQPTIYGVGHPITRFGSSEQDTRNIYKVLPGVYWSHPVHEVKPAARVLLRNANPVRRTSDNDLEPVVAIQNYGIGRVLYVGVDATWRWRALRDGYYYRRFWSNVLSHLGGLKVRQVVITATADRFTVGDRVDIEAEVLTPEYEPLEADTYDVELVNTETGEAETLALKQMPGKPGRFRLSWPADRTGSFEITAMRGDPQIEERVSAKRIRIELPQAETRRREADEAALRQTASRDENFCTLAEMDGLAERILPERLTTRQEVPREIWDSRLSLLLIVLLLGVEWILRKKHNMA